jgi:uncharacterized protein
MVNAYNIDAISIGNGTASRETEFLSRKLLLIERFRFYSFRGGCFGIFCIKIREEFNYDVTVRGSISIGRRLSDPLAELVKLTQKPLA